MNSDYDTFPAQVYADSVLAPDLDIYKQHFSAPLHAINLAHGAMLAEQHLLQPADSAAILAALLKIDKDRPWADQEFDGSFEDLFCTSKKRECLIDFRVFCTIFLGGENLEYCLGK